MSIKIYLDNNFFDEYDKCQDLSLKSKIKGAFQTKKTSFYPSKELLDEMVRILESEKRKDLWPERRRLFWELSPQRFFIYWGDIVRKEILGMSDSIYLTKSQEEQTRNILYRIEKAEHIVEIANVVKGENLGHWEWHKNKQEEIRIQKKQGLKRGEIKSFDEFNKKYWDIHGVSLLKDIILREEKDEDKAQMKACSTMNNIEQYSYINVFLRITSAMFFRYFFEDREVKESDYYDAVQLIYMAGLDVLITEDRSFKELCRLVFGSQKKIYSFNDINSLLS